MGKGGTSKFHLLQLNGGETIMDNLNAITGGYKKQFIEDIIAGMTPFSDNTQLLELNKKLNYVKRQIGITKHYAI